MGYYVEKDDIANWPTGYDWEPVLADADYSQENIDLRWNGMDEGCLRAFFFNGGFSDEMGHSVGEAKEVSYVQSKEGYGLAAEGNGASSHMVGDSGDDIDSLTTFSISFLLRPKSDGEANEGRVLDKTQLSVWVSDELDGLLRVNATIDYGMGTDALSTTERMVPVGVDSDIAITYEELGDRKLHIYLNGAEVAYQTQQAGVGTRSSDKNNDLYILNRAAGDRGFDGSVDRLLIHSRVLSLEEIKRLARNGLAAAWFFEDSCRDELGLHHGSPNLVTYVDGQAGNRAAAFLQSKSIVLVPKHPLISTHYGMRRFAVRVKIKVNEKPTATDSCYLVHKYLSGAGWVCGLLFDADGMRLWALENAAATDAYSESSNKIAYGQWHDLAFSYDDFGDRKFHLFADGGEMSYAQNDAAVGDLLSDVNAELGIGNVDKTTDRCLYGYIERCALYRRPLAPSELLDGELLSWVRQSRPVLGASGGEWDATTVRDPIPLMDQVGEIVQVDGKYVLYYTGGGAPNYEIGRALSEDGIHWEKNPSVAPVLSRGSAGQWDEYYVSMGTVIKMNDGTYRLYYSGRNNAGVYGLGLATSADGKTFQKHGSNPLITEASWNADALGVAFVTPLLNGTWALVFEGGPGYKVFLGTSSDGISWVAANGGEAVMEGTPNEWDKSGVANPKLYHLSLAKYMLGYNGTYGASEWQLGFAYSTDMLNWTKFGGNPVMLRGPAEWEKKRIESAFIAKQDIGTDAVRMWWFGGESTGTYFRAAYATCAQDARDDIFDLLDVSPWEKHRGFGLAGHDSLQLCELGGGAKRHARKVALATGTHKVSFLAYANGAEVTVLDVVPYAAPAAGSGLNVIQAYTYTAQGDGSYLCEGTFQAGAGEWMVGVYVGPNGPVAVSLPQCEIQGTGLSDAEKDAIIAEVEEYVENITRRIFRRREAVRYFDGDGKTLLAGFPEDIIEVKGVVIGDTTLVASDYRYGVRSISLRPLTETVPESGPYTYTTFPVGYRNVKVTLDEGMATTPPGVKRAVIILVEHRNDPNLHESVKGFTESAGDYHRGVAEPGQPGSLTGVIEADRLLLPYVRKRISLGAI